MSKLFFAGDIGDMQCLQVQYMSKCKVPNERGKGDDLGRFCKPLLRYKAKRLPPQQPVKLNVRYCPNLLRNLLRSAEMRLACDLVKKSA